MRTDRTVGKMASLDGLFGSPNATISSAIKQDGRIVVTWGNNSLSEFPEMFLRDCCYCEKCFSPTVNSRLTLFEQLLGASCQAKEVKVKVIWPP